MMDKIGKISLSPHAIGMIILLIIQYLLGMATTLFVQFPQGAHDGQLWIFAWHQILIVLHVIVGFLLIFGTIALAIRAGIQKNRIWIISSVISLLSVFGAITAGFIFIPTQANVYSLTMAVLFIVALLSYFWGLYSSR